MLSENNPTLNWITTREKREASALRRTGSIVGDLKLYKNNNDQLQRSEVAGVRGRRRCRRKLLGTRRRALAALSRVTAVLAVVLVPLVLVLVVLLPLLSVLEETREERKSDFPP